MSITPDSCATPPTLNVFTPGVQLAVRNQPLSGDAENDDQNSTPFSSVEWRASATRPAACALEGLLPPDHLARFVRYVLSSFDVADLEARHRNMVGAWFGILTRKSMRRGSSETVPALVRHIEAYIAEWNSHPTPFVWTKDPATIIRKAVRRGR